MTAHCSVGWDVHYERKQIMPKGHWDRTKTKAQRDAEKATAAGKTMKAAPAKVVKAPKTAKKPGPKPGLKKAEVSFGPMPTNKSIHASSACLKERAEVLMDYATLLLNMSVAKTTMSLDDRINSTLARLDMVMEEAQHLPTTDDVLEVVDEVEDLKEATPVKQTVAQVPAPVPMALPAPVPFNPASPPNGS